MNTEIAKAITAVMADIHRLKKTDKNDHGGYKYVSVDDFKDLVRPLMAQHGLSLSMTELDYQLETLQGRHGPTVNAKITYEFRLRHTSGEADEPERATIMLPHTGAQTAGAAKSYAIKEYLKGRFLVSTGDKDMIEGGADADAFKQQDYTAAPKKNITPHEDDHQKVGPKLLTVKEARELYAKLRNELYKLPSFREVSQWEKTNELDIAKLGDWKSYMDKEIEKHLRFIDANTPQSEAAE